MRAWNIRWIFDTPFGIKFCTICSSSAALFGPFFVRLSASPAVEYSHSIRISVLTIQFCLDGFIMLTGFFQVVIFGVSVRIMGVIVRAWSDDLERDYHTESVRLDRFALWCDSNDGDVLVFYIQSLGKNIYYHWVDSSAGGLLLRWTYTSLTMLDELAKNRLQHYFIKM